jgi:S1/P1 Nuclease
MFGSACWFSPSIRCFLLAVTVTAPRPALAWGDERQEIVAPSAEHYLDQAARTKVAMLLVLDPDTLTDHDLASEATWAGKYRESDRDTTKIRYQGTRRCHFVDIELAEPRLDTAYFGHPPLPAGVLAWEGPPQACVADRIEQFVAELGNPATGASEQLLSLKYVLHFVGDLLQALHAADDHDPGGNKKLVTADRLHAGNLHGFWDIELVEMPRIDPRQVAVRLIGQISEAQRQQWSPGSQPIGL